jgi:glyceraldehyde 3-phosphate dehydrogenase
MTRVAINGFGRIGRAFFRSAYGNKDFEIVAINDLGSLENLAYLLQYDSVYGRSRFSVEVTEGKLMVDGKEVAFLQQRDPAQLPWADMKIDLVLESTGFFTSYEGSKKHLTAGAKRVVISAPAKDDAVAAGVRGATILMGVNDDQMAVTDITSNASCTTMLPARLLRS